MSPLRRDGEGNCEAAPTWESLIDRQIREAMAAGEFDETAYAGRRLPVQDDPSGDDERSIADHLLRQAGVAPPWIETDRELRDILERIDRLLDRASRSSPLAHQRDRDELAGLVATHERLAFRLEQEAPTPAQHRPHLDRGAELARLGEIHAGRSDPGRAPVRASPEG
jgi:hypothetical protein